jgi:hypothetical protein
MLKQILKYKFPILLVLALYIIHLNVKDCSSSYEKPIVGDAKAYYAYLPAIFIYQDSQFGFVDDYEEMYYAENQKKDFLNTTENGKKVNKTFPGAAILYLPFFLIAHALALLFGLNSDGYSLIYQYLFDFGYWVYLLLGAIYFVKTFRLLKFNNKHIYISLATLLIGTNVLFYSVVDQSVTHIFNFAMINALIYHLLKYKEAFRSSNLIISVCLLLLIGITRPTNIIVLLLIPIFISDKIFYINLTKSLFKPKHVFVISLITLIIGSIPFLLWHWQTGNWIVYSYGDEGFDFSNPELLNFLLSYTKGWFTYTPIALLILIVGLVFQFKQNKIKGIQIVVFYALSVYVFSSWWCWFYGAGMSQRVMIDHYILLGYLLLISLKNLGPMFKKSLFFLLVILTFFNVIQTIQIKKGIYKMGSPTKEIYWDNFLSLNLKAKVYNKSNWELLEKHNISFNKVDGFISKGAPKGDENKFFIQTNQLETYSASFKVKFKEPTTKMVISWTALAQNKIENSQLVINSIGENSQNRTIYLKDFMIINSPTKMEFLVEFETRITEFEAYFWNGNSNELVDYFNLKVESYK